MTPLTRRVTAHYRNANPSQLQQGEGWYAEAHTVARDQSETYGVTIEVAAGVIAATSPRVGWGPNVMLAERMLMSGGTMTRGALSRSLTQARRIYAGEPIDTVLRGPKTNAFFYAILTAGESETAVIDRHAWDMMVGERQAAAPTLKQYREADQIMRRAGKILGVGTHVVQATTWLVQRHLYWNPGAFDGRRQPMLEGAESWQ